MPEDTQQEESKSPNIKQSPVMEVIDEDDHEDTQHSILMTNSEVKVEVPEPKTVTMKPETNSLAIEKP